MSYSKKTVAELRMLAMEKGIVNAADMKKKDLVELLENIDRMMQEKNAEAPKKEEPVEKKSETPKKSAAGKKTVGRGRRTVKKEADSEENVKQEETTSVEPEFQKPEEDTDENEQETAPDYINDGILEILPEGYGFLRSDNYMPGTRDVYLAPTQIRKFRLKTGDVVSGPIKKNNSANDKYSGLLYIDKVNGMSPEEVKNRTAFEDLTPIFPDERIRLDYDNAPRAIRIVDFFSPIGKGQRGMIVSPPKAGKTTLLKQIAKRITSSSHR